MTVMDVTPEALYELLEPQRQAGTLRAHRVRRCHSRHCLQIGLYDFNGQLVVITKGLKLSPRLQSELGLPRHVRGRAWIGDRAPSGQWYGCDHALFQTT